MLMSFMKTLPSGEPSGFIEKIEAGTKIHSLRGPRWKAGMKIHMCTGARTKAYQLHYIRLCVSTQKILIDPQIACVAVFREDLGKYVELSKEDKNKLAINDGFDSFEQFINFWYPQQRGIEFILKTIVHWTSFKY